MKCLIIGILIILSIPALAQKDTAKSSIPIVSGRKGELIMDLGAGLSKIDWLLEGLFGPGPNIISETPAINSAFDYYVTNRTSLGVGITFQEIKDNPYVGGNPVNWVTEYVTRTNIAARWLTHFIKNPETDYYIGLRIGLSFWTDNDESPNYGYYSLGYAALSNSNIIMRGSVQILIGLRSNPSNLLSIHLEGGIGTPYFLEGGISIRLIKSKGNK